MNAIKINLIKTNNCLGVDFYTGAIQLRHLFSNYHVAHYKSDDELKDGYQRKAQNNRIINISKRVSDIETIAESFIDCVHLNLRSQGAINFVKASDNKENYGANYYFEYTPEFGKFYIEDGQTRIRGAELAYEKAISNGDHAYASKIADVFIPINLSFCSDGNLEAFIFYLINYYSKKIPPEGEIALLKKGYESGHKNFVEEIKNNSKESAIFSAQIAEKLNNDSQVWNGEMRDFNDGIKGGKKPTIVSVSRMIKPLYEKFSVKSDDPASVKKAVYEIVDAYWTALKALYPKMFADKTKGDFNIFNSSSAEVMMKVLKAFIDDQYKDADEGGKQIVNLTAPDTYKKFLVNLRNIKDVNKLNDTVSGADIFKVGREGSLGRYGGNDGKKDIARKIYYVLFPTKAVNF